MKIEHQVRAFEQLFSAYDGSIPLNRFLPVYFKQNKQMGSSDRRWATRYIYGFFRLGKALSELSVISRLAVADFLCNDTPSLVTQHYLPSLSEEHGRPLEEKIDLIQDHFPDFDRAEVFPFHAYLSDDIDQDDFLASFFVQPDLYLRVRERDMKGIKDALEAANIGVKTIGQHTLSLTNGSKLEQILPGETFHYQVQDLSSQRTGALFMPKKYDYWWDCCAASGGKSLLLHDLEPKIELLVSDLREGVLHNLDERFGRAGILKYQRKVLDLLQNNEQDLHHYEFDGIILDAPCSGSGTWGRSPELSYYFKTDRISFFSTLQKSIAANVIPYLKSGKPLIYITCSVFKSENEEVVDHLLKTQPLTLEKMEVIKGYGEKADTMFAARLIRK